MEHNVLGCVCFCVSFIIREDTHGKCLGFHHAEAVLNAELLVNLPSFQEKGGGSMIPCLSGSGVPT